MSERTLGVTPIGEALLDVGLDPIWGYISQRHISVAQYIAMRKIFDLAVAEERRTISPDAIISREQKRICFRNEGRGADES